MQALGWLYEGAHWFAVAFLLLGVAVFLVVIGADTRRSVEFSQYDKSEEDPPMK